MEAELSGVEEYLSCEPEKRWLDWILRRSSTTLSTAMDPSVWVHKPEARLLFFWQYQTEISINSSGVRNLHPPTLLLIKCGPYAKCCECVQAWSTAAPSGDRKWDTDEVWWDAEPLHCWFVRLLRASSLSGLHYLLPDGRKRLPGKRCYHGGLVWNLILRLQSPTSLLHDRMWKLTWISAWGPSPQGIF